MVGHLTSTSRESFLQRRIVHYRGKEHGYISIVPLFQSALEKNSADLRLLQSQQMQNRQLQDQIQQLQAMQTKVQEHQASVTRTLQHQQLQQQQEVIVLQPSPMLNGSVMKYVDIEDTHVLYKLQYYCMI